MLEKIKGFRKLIGLVLGLIAVALAGALGVPTEALGIMGGMVAVYLGGQSAVDLTRKPAPKSPAPTPEAP